MRKPTSSQKRAATAIVEDGENEPQGIRFYRANEKPYGVFSNLFRRPIVFEDRNFPTAEHAYQAGKARKEEVREWTLNAPTPDLVSMAAHGLYTWDIAPNWSRIEYDRMRRVLRAKFSQHADLQQILLSTDNARLVEAGRVDNAVNRTWGEVNGRGLNMLGLLLMEIRSEFRKELPLQKTKLSDTERQTCPARRASVVHGCLLLPMRKDQHPRRTTDSGTASRLRRPAARAI